MRKLLIKIIFLSGSILIPLGLYNYQTDYFGIFQRELDDRYNEPNMRFIKTQYILENPSKYETLIFGSSRAGKILAHMTDKSVYNFYYSQGLPAEFLEDITLLVERKLPIKKIFIALDEFSFKTIPSKHKSQLLRRRYYDDFSEDAVSYLEYLIDPPKIGTPSFSIATTFDYANTGNPLHFAVDSIIESDVSKHINDKKFKNMQMNYGNRINKTVQEIATIKSLCGDHNIECVFFFNPIYISTYLQYPTEELLDLKKRLTEVTPFIDFSGVNKITTNPYNYYESSHYRYMIGDSIWNRISNKPSANDFGVYISKQNIEIHLENELKAVTEYRQSKD